MSTKRHAAFDASTLPDHVRGPFEGHVLHACEELYSKRSSALTSDMGDLDALVDSTRRIVAAYKTRYNHTRPAVSLPNEILVEIAGYADDDTLNGMRGTCMSWKTCLDACSLLWNQLAWTCLAPGCSSTELEQDLQLLDTRLTRGSRIALYINIPHATHPDGRVRSAIAPYIPTFEHHHHRVFELSFVFMHGSDLQFLHTLPEFPAVWRLKLKLARKDDDDGNRAMAPIVLMPDHFARVASFPRLKRLVIVNFIFNDILHTRMLDRVQELHLGYDMAFCARILSANWLACAWASCPTLKVFRLDVDFPITQIFHDLVPIPDIAGRTLDELVILVVNGSQESLRTMQHALHTSVTVSWTAWDPQYWILADLEDAKALNLSSRRYSSDAVECEDENADPERNPIEVLTVEVLDHRGFTRTIEYILKLEESSFWDYRSVWQYISPSRLHRITVTYQHWRDFCADVALPKLEELVVRMTVHAEPLPTTDSDKLNSISLSSLRTARFELARTTREWRHLPEGCVESFLRRIDTETLGTLRVELNHWARLHPVELAIVQGFVREVVARSNSSHARLIPPSLL
ncbi:hypothetical protein EXIGLDRAFT_839640 [Exidia glandulosa HHB12029]|uniref:F-box domain-containing protein n=1 Tax=Exidia glandulosa HHB12029 TaxID=1314781 RepID=A0A165EWG6_EXIGL|nr:hypothetical protein EXIGLDRAFT_839640 [Exidia glandulosa HHB12029]